MDPQDAPIVFPKKPAEHRSSSISFPWFSLRVSPPGRTSDFVTTYFLVSSFSPPAISQRQAPDLLLLLLTDLQSTQLTTTSTETFQLFLSLRRIWEP